MQGRGHIFDSSSRLQEMFSLRMAGSGPSDLGRKYGVDHSTIIYHCRRAGYSFVRGQSIIQTTLQMTYKNAVLPKCDTFDGSPINPGRNYAEYVEARKKRKEQEFWAKLHKEPKEQ